MDCAYNIITANFSGGKTHATTARVYQWSRGIELCITGADNLPQTFKAHFSVQKKGGVATTIVGIDERVTVPNVLFTIGKDIHVWLGASETEDDAEILYTVDIPVAPAPMPEYYDAEDTGVFDAVVEQVADYAATATAAANSAGASATAAAGSASAAAASASSAAGSATAAEQARADAVTAKGQAETAAQTATQKAQQTAQDAAQAALDAGRAESAAERAESAETGAGAAKTAAEAAAQSAAASASAASASATSAGQSATAAAGSASAAAQSATSIEGDVQIASQKASEAQTAAGQAVTAKDAAVTAQQGAEAAATNAGQSASTATAKASEAATSASNAAQSKTDAEAAATRAEQAAASLTVDDALSDTSTNPVQNKVITAELTDVKSAFDDLVDDTMTTTAYTEQIIPTVTTESGYMGTNGAVTGSSSYVHTNAIDVQDGDVIAPVASGYVLRFVTAFDADGNAVTAKGAGQVYTYTVPAGIKKVVVSYSASYSAMQIAITRTLYNYEVTGLAEVIQSVDGLGHANLITGWSSYHVNFYVPTYEAHEMNTSGVVGTSTAYKHSEKIPVSEGDIVTIYKDNMTRAAFDRHTYAMRFVTAFSGDTAVSASGGNIVGIYTVPQGIDGIVVSVFVSNSSADHEQQIRIATPITEDFSNAFDVLNGKKYVACGDSFTAAGYDNTDGYPFNYYTFASGRFAGQNRTYPWIIGLRNGMNVVNMAVSGMSMANSTGSNAFVLDDYYKGIPADADYITLKFGINDLNHGTVIGTIDSDDPTTFYGAWNIVMAYITENHPLAKVGIIVTNGLGSANQYADAIIAIAKKWGVPYLDEVYDDKVPLLHRVNRPDVSSAVIQKKLETFRVSATNTHPNVNAQYYEAAFVENWLKSL